jgi:hypothetical protein
MSDKKKKVVSIEEAKRIWEEQKIKEAKELNW